MYGFTLNESEVGNIDFKKLQWKGFLFNYDCFKTLQLVIFVEIICSKTRFGLRLYCSSTLPANSLVSEGIEQCF